MAIRRCAVVCMVGGVFLATGCGASKETRPPSTASQSPTSLVVVGQVPGAQVASSLPAGPQASGGAQDASVLPITNAAPLLSGRRYGTTEVTGPIMSVSFELPVDGLFALKDQGLVTVSSDEAAAFPLLDIVQLDNTLVFNRPTIDMAMMPDAAFRDAVLQRPPADYLGWLGQQPSITAGTITDTTLDGHSARSMTYEIGTIPQGLQCAGTGQVCYSLTWAPVTGFVTTAFEGQRGTMYELTIAGNRMLVDVIDTLDANKLEQSLRFDVAVPPGAPPSSEPVPFTGPHTGGARYFSERSSAGLYLLNGFDDIDTSASLLRDTSLVLQSGGVDCLSITDGSAALWLGTTLSGVARGSIVPQDLLGAIAADKSLRVTDGPHPIKLGAVAAMSVDVEPVGEGVGLLDAGVPAVQGKTTRIIVVARDDVPEPDVIVTTIGSPCEPVLATIELVAEHRPSS